MATERAAWKSATPAELRAARAVARSGARVQRRAAKELDPEAYKAWKGWTWGRRRFEITEGEIDKAPARLVVLFDLEAIEYLAAKGKGSRLVAYRHVHEAPFARVATTPAGARHYGPAKGTKKATPPRVVDTARHGAPRFEGPSVFQLGILYALEGRNAAGDRMRIDFGERDGFVLVGDPTWSDMHIVRQSKKAQAEPPIFVLRGRSPYVLTDRGIER